MSERSLLRRSPNSFAVLIALALALLTIISGLVLLLALGFRSSHWSVEGKTLMPEQAFDSALNVPAIILLTVICLLVFPLLWRYRRRGRRATPPES